MEYNNLASCIVAVLSAAWFGLMAHKLQKGIVLWCIGGAVLGLGVGTICLGLANAATVPYTPSEIHRTQWVGITCAVVVVGVTGAIIALVNRYYVTGRSQ